MNYRLILWIVFLLAGSALGHYMLQGSGYVLISFQHWVVETSLWVFVILLITTILSIYASIQFFSNLLKSPAHIQNWREQRGNKQAINKTVQGLLALAEGDWKKSGNLLLAGAHGKGKLINYLAAARAAQQIEDYEHSDELLLEASKSTKGAELAVGLQQAQLQLERKQYEQSLATCLRLKTQFPKHSYVNKMLLKTHMALEDWQAVLDLLPQLNKHKLLPNKQSKNLETKAYGKLVENLIHSRNSSNRDPKVLLDIWQGIPKRTIKQLNFAPLAQAFIKHLISLNAHQEAEAELRKILDHHWNAELIHLYGCVKGKDSQRQLLFCKDQLKNRPNDAILLLTLGRLSMLNEAFEQAQVYFEDSLALENNAEVRSELGRLYLAKNDSEKALDMLRQGVGLALAELPLPNAG